MVKRKTWIIKTERPEETFSSPLDYYTNEKVEKYSKSRHMKKTQGKLALRLIELMEISPPGKILDIGCGTGFSMEALTETGFDVEGIDIIPEMLKKAKEKGFKVKKCDMQELSRSFPEHAFNHIISISAFQWIKSKADIQKISHELYKLLKPKGKVGIQFYPKSEIELKQFTKTFSKKFTGKIVIDNENIPRKRIIFVILEK